ncbi:MFS transporter [Streptomyces sp. NPDC020965]|uniref:MFS transporter n=1 Tax=Streptomyces sp. NPDC020965 TaxID=3365105 RepID=UPI0037AEDDF1
MAKRYGLGRYAAGAAAARTGDEMSGPALLLLGLAVTGSAVSASALLAGVMIASALGGPLIGVLLDRAARPGRLLAAALTGYALALLAVLTCLGRLPLPVTVLIAVCAGLLGPALAGGWTAQLPRIAPGGGLARANAVDAMTYHAAGLLGPALAGVVAQLAGASAGVVVSTVLICLALPAAWSLPAALPGARRREPTASIATELRAGFRATTGNPHLARATATTSISCAAEGMFVACAPLLWQWVLGGAGRGALLLSGVALVALAVNALLARRAVPPRPETVIRWSPVVLAVAFALAATGGTVPLCAAVLLAGIGEGPQLTALFAIRHREAPERLRGQVFTTGASLKLTSFAVGAGVAGPLATWSLPGALLTAAGVQLLAALCFARWPGRPGGPDRTAAQRIPSRSRKVPEPPNDGSGSRRWGRTTGSRPRAAGSSDREGSSS